MTRRAGGWAALAVAIAALAGAAASPPQKTPPTVTFFMASDSHFGARGMEEANRILVEQMNALPGTEYPPELGGRVAEPRGVLFGGDTTDTGDLSEFALFESVYGLTGKDGLLRFPVYEAVGNHDVNSESPIKERVKLRHGGIDYSLDWADIHVACLDMYPDATTLAWLEQDLKGRSRSQPLIVFFHYSLEGHYSDFWEPEQKEALARALFGRNVLAIFHGHEHGLGHYVWRGYPVFRPGSPRHSSHAFLAVRVGAREMSVAGWDFDRKAWRDSWTIPVKR